MGEQPIFTTKAHVFQIDPTTKKKWLPASNQAVCVSYYYDSTRNTYRIISVEGSKAVINSTITPNMTFTKTSVKFGQWSDARANTVYGLGFSTEAELTKFIEKFKEIKELTRGVGEKPTTTVNGNANISDAINSTNENSTNISVTSNHSPIASPKPIAINAQNDSISEHVSTPNIPALPEQLKYENDRLKIALAQSSANAKKWEIELQTLKNNNARLTTALQESTANVEEWKKQLALYKEDSARMKKKVLESDNIKDLREKLTESQKEITRQQEEINSLKKRINDMGSFESQRNSLVDKIKTLEEEKAALLEQVENVKLKQNEEMRSVQGQISSKLAELYSLNDKLADMVMGDG